MYLRTLYLHHFRNYEEASFEFSPSLNFICGPNAVGKTSILEAIYYLMVGRSFRSHHYQDIVQAGHTSFYLEAAFIKHGIDQKLRIYFENGERKIIYNHTQLPNQSSLLGIIPGVVTTPDDVNLIKGSPLLRRQFLDIQLAQIDPLYVHHLTRYVRAMRHRNHLLKINQLVTIESWEQEMAQSAAYIVQQRLKAIEDLSRHAKQFYEALTGETESLDLTYRAPEAPHRSLEESKDYYIRQFHKNRQREIGMGHTLIGPHKDDLLIAISKRDARYYASEGQQRSCVTALHFAEWQRLKRIGEATPLLLIDDVGMSLDENRKTRLLKQIEGLGQVFLSTTDENLIQAFSGLKKIFSLPWPQNP
ncbi:DNA replication/repair protein RecF [Candidatus Protochlamydia phocaeensis]|uniref:DNA replication/repair protein RecF n=1 Tax=Candidatus Protochlamydia phocaeensis TaxID=1414722 RepID=UPI00083842E7|nr:DNA replication/repair protein RecF [Candidatus Protochlamydia phocaeensis]